MRIRSCLTKHHASVYQDDRAGRRLSSYFLIVLFCIETRSMFGGSNCVQTRAFTRSMPPSSNKRAIERASGVSRTTVYRLLAEGNRTANQETRRNQ